MRTCESDTSHDGWHWYRCSRPAKYIYTNVEGKQVHLCGIHARRYRDDPNLVALTTVADKKVHRKRART